MSMILRHDCWYSIYVHRVCIHCYFICMNFMWFVWCFRVYRLEYGQERRVIFSFESISRGTAAATAIRRICFVQSANFDSKGNVSIMFHVTGTRVLVNLGVSCVRLWTTLFQGIVTASAGNELRSCWSAIRQKEDFGEISERSSNEMYGFGKDDMVVFALRWLRRMGIDGHIQS